MSRISVPLNRAYHLINHGACPLITTADGARRNVSPINWTTPLLDDPFLVTTVIEETIFTNELIRASGEFCINVVSEDWGSVMLGLGRLSGRNGDKFARFNIATALCEKIQVPRLADAFVHVECRVKDSHIYSGVVLYVAEVLHAEVEQEFFDGKHLILEKARTLHHVGGGLFAVANATKRFEAAKPVN